MEYHILNTCFEYIFIFKAVLTHLKRSRPLLVLGAVRRQQQGAPLVNKVMQQQWLERTEGGRTGAVQLTHQQEKQRQEARQAQQYVPGGFLQKCGQRRHAYVKRGPPHGWALEASETLESEASLPCLPLLPEVYLWAIVPASFIPICTLLCLRASPCFLHGVLS